MMVTWTTSRKFSTTFIWDCYRELQVRYTLPEVPCPLTASSPPAPCGLNVDCGRWREVRYLVRLWGRKGQHTIKMAKWADKPKQRVHLEMANIWYRKSFANFAASSRLVARSLMRQACLANESYWRVEWVTVDLRWLSNDCLSRKRLETLLMKRPC